LLKLNKTRRHLKTFTLKQRSISYVDVDVFFKPRNLDQKQTSPLTRGRWMRRRRRRRRRRMRRKSGC
jgi:hypothetical protein